ncbi:MAG: serine--tRNA ligase [Oceanicaulis sp.]
MHDIRLIRDNPGAFDAAMKRRGLTPQAERLIDLDARRREATTRLQELETRRNAVSKEIGAAKARGENDRFEALRSEVEALKGEMDRCNADAAKAEEVLNQALAALPNAPAEDVPDGEDEHDNEEVRGWGEPREFDFEPADHVTLGERLGLDFERAAAMSGARFAVMQGPLARLERALGQFMLDMHTTENGYRETSVPYLVRDEALFGTGQLPKFAEDLYLSSSFIGPFSEKEVEAGSIGLYFETAPDTIVMDDMSTFVSASGAKLLSGRRWLIPTAEVPLTNLVRDAIHAEGDFPLRLTALTPCFRSEAGSAGRDTRGLIRMHQFHKVELVSVVAPEQSEEELERMTGCAEAVLRALELPYRVMALCAGDMGFAARKTYDLEVWLPSQKTYREISSCSNCGDFQARRMNARLRREGEKKPEFLHTLNGSGVAVGRALVAILENHQNADGSVTIPAALRPYMGGVEVIRP